MLPIAVRLSYYCLSRKQSLLWRAAIAFLMFMFLCSLYDTDHCDNDTDNCHYNTNNTDYYIRHHILYLSLYFPFVPPPKILEALRMYSFWRKVNRLPFSLTPHKQSISEKINDFTFPGGLVDFAWEQDEFQAVVRA